MTNKMISKEVNEDVANLHHALTFDRCLFSVSKVKHDHCNLSNYNTSGHMNLCRTLKRTPDQGPCNIRKKLGTLKMSDEETDHLSSITIT